MELKVYVCDNCRCSVNENNIYHMKNGCAYLHLCDRCKEKFSKFEIEYDNKLEKLIDEFKEQMKEHFKNIYERLY